MVRIDENTRGPKQFLKGTYRGTESKPREDAKWIETYRICKVKNNSR